MRLGVCLNRDEDQEQYLAETAFYCTHSTLNPHQTLHVARADRGERLVLVL